MTKEDAKLARADVISRLGRGEKDRRAPKRFHEYATSVIDAMDYAPNTRWKYEYHLRLHLTRFHKLKLSDIDVDKVAALVAQMKKQKYAGSTIGGALTALSVVMDKAVRNGYAVANPVRQLEKSERPKKNSHERRILNQQEIARLLEHARSYRPLIAFLLFTGVRIGEALGMQWQDIDFAAENIHVRAQLGRDLERRVLKTVSGHRKIVLMPELARVMREHKMASPFSQPTDYVFASDTGTARHHRTADRGIRAAVKRANLGDGISPHSFRHTFASVLIVGLGYDAVSVSRQLGHSTPTVTLSIYAHMFDESKHHNALREKLDKGYGHLLADGNKMSTSTLNLPQEEVPQSASISAIGG
jgi:integrase